MQQNPRGAATGETQDRAGARKQQHAVEGCVPASHV
jgi:hypothetical protein